MLTTCLAAAFWAAPASAGVHPAHAAQVSTVCVQPARGANSGSGPQAAAQLAPKGGGTDLVLGLCDGGMAQRWSLVGGTVEVGGACLQAADVQNRAGSPVRLQTCDGGANQRWTVLNGAVTATASGLCLTDPAGPGVQGVALVVNPCDGSAREHWALSGSSSRSLSALLRTILIALIPLALGILVLMTGPRALVGSAAARVRGRLPRRTPRLSGPLRRLWSDPATVDDAVTALAEAGRGPDRWPYAATVSAREATVWLAGERAPEPSGLWSPVEGDPLAWTALRSELPERTAEPGEPSPRPVMLGVADGAVVVLDAARSPGVLVIEGAERPARRLRSNLLAQAGAVEVFLRGSGADPAAGRSRWVLAVDADSWITVHGRRVRLVGRRLAPVADHEVVVAVPAPRGRTAALDQPSDGIEDAAPPALPSAADLDPDTPQREQREAPPWGTTAVSSRDAEPIVDP